MVMKSWAELTKDEFFEIAQLRCEVFFVEQRVDVQDFDDADRAADTLHLYARDDDGVAAYLRVIGLAEPEFGASRAFGRVAVRKDRRGEGLAKRLIAPVVERWGSEAMVLHSQAYIVPLYEAFGFEVVGEPYVEAGIPHRSMLRAATSG
ncbi:MAG: GNAT family N-acetyltransferase [Propionibacterium sp.]|nr:GNAT family N-acetyltransferase [Propionibacterium sp.]